MKQDEINNLTAQLFSLNLLIEDNKKKMQRDHELFGALDFLQISMISLKAQKEAIKLQLINLINEI
jgi:hypothetical protein